MIGTIDEAKKKTASVKPKDKTETATKPAAKADIKPAVDSRPKAESESDPKLKTEDKDAATDTHES
jgi:hypothetical protein